MFDVIIIGKGPAGISASLYTARANLKTLIIGKGSSALRKTEKIDNYFGFSKTVSGEFLLQEGEKQATRLGAEFLEDEVISIEKNDFFEVLTGKDKFLCKTVLLATGQTQRKILIKNIEEFEGRGVSYCTTCDGFFYKNLKVGVLGFKDFAIHEALELMAFTKDITVFTNGKDLDLTEKYQEATLKFNVNFKPIYKIDGADFLEKVVFEDGTGMEIDGIFIAYDSASSTDFARKMGILTEENAVLVDKFQSTNLDGLFAAGDCTGGFKQISTAVGQGALAGRKMIEYVRSL